MAERRVSGAELARRLNVKQPYISRRLTGEVEFRLSDLQDIAAALGVPVTQLLPATEPAGDAR
jgi:transcriptional regulator with XRE-family HTH domain